MTSELGCAHRVVEFLNATAHSEISTLSLHDALPIYLHRDRTELQRDGGALRGTGHAVRLDVRADRKSTRLNSSHSQTSYAVFCLKKKNSRERAPHCGPALSAGSARRPRAPDVLARRR